MNIFRAIVTMSTVGYGDYVPVTIPGKVLLFENSGKLLYMEREFPFLDPLSHAEAPKPPPHARLSLSSVF